MRNKILLDKINTILKERNISASRASIDAGLGPDFVRKLKNAKNYPKIDALFKLAKILNIDVNYFLEAIDSNTHYKKSNRQDIFLKTIYIQGIIQAGHWNKSIQWPRKDWLPITIPDDPKYKDLPIFALVVKGDSMNLLFPNGSIIITVNFSDLKRKPEDGECIIITRRDPLTDHYETTLKIVQIRNDDSVWLWPRSNNPDYLKPIQLPKMAMEYQSNNSGQNFEIVIQSLVIWSFNSTKKVKL